MGPPTPEPRPARRAALRPVAAVVVCWAMTLGRVTPAAALTADEVVDRVQAVYRSIGDLQAHFRQTSTLQSLGQVQESAGVVYLKKPGKMRWEYEHPEKRLYVTDGKTLWAYSPEDRQVIEQDVQQAFGSSTPMSFLMGAGNLREDFTYRPIEHAGTRGKGTYLLELLPRRSGSTLQKMILEVNLKTFLIEKATLLYVTGNTTVLAFSNVRVNGGLADGKFEFSPPPGVDVLRPPKPAKP